MSKNFKIVNILLKSNEKASHTTKMQKICDQVF